MVETNPEIGRVYPQKTMLEEGSIGPDPQFIDNFLAIRSMVEEMYKDFRKHKDEDASGSKQDKGEDESFLHDHSKGKEKEEHFLTPPNSPEHKKKASLIKRDVKFDLHVYDGELNAKKLDNWIRTIDVYAECRVSIQTRARFSWQAYALEALPWVGGKA